MSTTFSDMQLIEKLLAFIFLNFLLSSKIHLPVACGSLSLKLYLYILVSWHTGCWWKQFKINNAFWIDNWCVSFGRGCLVNVFFPMVFAFRVLNDDNTQWFKMKKKLYELVRVLNRYIDIHFVCLIVISFVNGFDRFIVSIWNAQTHWKYWILWNFFVFLYGAW